LAVGTGELLGVQTLWTQNSSDPRHFGTIILFPKCTHSSATVQCHWYWTALNCLDFHQTFLCCNWSTDRRKV